MIMETILKKEIITSKASARIIGALIFLILTILGAFVRIPLPFTPVPVTFQTLFVLLAGAFLGSGIAGFVQLTYILLGVSGIPVFTNAGFGLLYILGPTGGYLLGFIFAGLFAGRFIKYAGNKLFYIFLIFCIADFVLLLSGTVWLKLVLKCSLSRAFSIGFIPFVYADIIKISAATLIYLKFKSRIKNL